MRIWLVLKNSDKNSKCIVPFDYYVTNMNINTPQKPENSNNSTCTEIRNAWVGFTYVDNRGIIWIDVDRLNSILRTSKPRAKYELLQIDDSAKLRQGNKTYIRAYNLIGILEKFIQESKIGKRREYLKYSEQIYRAIRDSNDVLVIGEKYNAFLENERKGLKKKRINKYNIKNDELTGDILRRKTAEFSHIRNYCIYREISSDIENGLIVNKETHVIITKKGINDENELKELCIEKGWNLEWYKKYKNYFNIR